MLFPRPLTLFALAPLCLQLLAQAGANDPSFNTADPGNGLGDGPGFPIGWVNALALQPDGKVVVVGSFSTYNGFARDKVARINADGTLDQSLDPGNSTGIGADTGIDAVVIQPDGKILIAGSFVSFDGTPRSKVARLNADGSLDPSFDPAVGPDDNVTCLALQPDGKIIIGGWFTTWSGTVASHIARLNVDGTLDLTFDTGTGADFWVNAVAVLSNGQVMAVGMFDAYDGLAWSGVARINTDGSPDATFDPGDGMEFGAAETLVVQPDGKLIIGGDFAYFDNVPGCVARLNTDGSPDPSFSSDAIGTVKALALQSDGKILVGGDFVQYNGVAMFNITRINDDGSLDATFQTGSGTDDHVEALLALPSGASLVGGWFEHYDGLGHRGIVQLETDGTIDADFNPPSGLDDRYVLDIVSLPDASILIAGWFTQYNNTPRRYLAHLDANGDLDAAWDPGNGINGVPIALQAQPDGKLIVGGAFTDLNGVQRNRVARFESNGTLDTTFDPGPGPDNVVHDVCVQPDGKIIVVGSFLNCAGSGRNRLARLEANGDLDNAFDPGDGANDIVNQVVLQPDGKILIVGPFTAYDGVAAGPIARLNADGSLDGSFQTDTSLVAWRIALNADGKIIVAGTVSGLLDQSPLRLNTDGSIDGGFHVGTLVGYISDLVIQPDGKLLLVGGFISFDGIARSCIVRLDADGYLDNSFDPGTGANEFYIRNVAQDVYGRAVIAGGFTNYAGAGRNRIARTLADTPLSVGQVDAEGMELFPNPCRTDLTIRMDAIGDAEIRLMDLTGRIVLRQHLRTEGGCLTLRGLGAFAPGVYSIAISNGERTLKRPIVID